MNISIRVLRNQSSYILLGLPEIRIKKKVVIRSLIINFENYNPITLQPAYKSYKNSGENWNGKKKNNKTASLLHFKNHIASIIVKLNNSIRMWKKTILSLQNSHLFLFKTILLRTYESYTKTSLSRSQELCIKSYVTFTHVFKRRTIMHVYLH